jgi:hypothetical protein
VTLIGQGDLVANEWSARGTHDAPLPRPDGGHYAPTGRSFARSGVGMVELRDSKIVGYRDLRPADNDPAARPRLTFTRARR